MTNPVPSTQKEIIGRMFDKAFSDDPQIACQAIGKLVVLLRSTAKQIEDDETVRMLITEQIGANRAWYEYSGEHNPGRAMQTVRAVLTNISHLAFDSRYTTLDAVAFLGGGK